ncbi:MAG: chorismate-binding protein, partial [Deltaproteobacteria bacterium]|nr:chorismate-binding protein [Deltaproteobacteria bacterium]
MSSPQTATRAQNSEARAGTRERLLSRLRAALASARPGQLVSVSAPIAGPRSAMPRIADIAWSNASSRVFASGETAVLTSRGPNRFGDIQRQADSLYARLQAGERVRLFGGFAFDGRPLGGTVWTDFAEARFVLPRWQLSSGPRGTELTLTVEAGSAPPVSQLGSELDRWLVVDDGKLSSPVCMQGSAQALAKPRAHEGHAFRQRVAAIIAAIASGPLQKVVTARRSDITLPTSVDVPAVMRRLEQLYPACFRFVVTAGESLLLGAPPELLVRVTGRRVESEALAGSIATTAADAAGRLLASDKDRAEHDLVVRELESQLAPVCSELEIPREPEIRALR